MTSNHKLFIFTAVKSPVITEGLQNQTKIDRSKGVHTLSCSASGDPPPEMLWAKDGVQLRKGPMRPTSQRHMYQSNLVMTRLGSEDEGQYSCTAANLGGSDTSVSDILILRKCKPKCIMKYSDNIRPHKKTKLFLVGLFKKFDEGGRFFVWFFFSVMQNWHC